MSPNNCNAVVYLRVSSRGQNDPERGRVGHDTQRHAIREYARNNNITITGTYEDVGSAFRNIHKLTGFRQMIDDLTERYGDDEYNEQSGTVILIYDSSRFSRHLLEGVSAVAELNPRIRENIHSIPIFSVSENIYTRDKYGVYNFNSAINDADKQSAMLSDKVKASYRRRREDGHFMGNRAPYGFEIYRRTGDDVDSERNPRGIRTLRPVANEMAVINIIMHQIYNRVLAVDVVDYLRNNNIRHRDGTLFTTSMVMSIYNKHSDRRNLEFYIPHNQQEDLADLLNQALTLGHKCNRCNEEFGDEDVGEILTCDFCDKKFHTNCTYMQYTPTKKWVCIDCAECPGCQTNIRYDDTLICDNCEERYHNTCYGGDHADCEGNADWICDECRPTSRKAMKRPRKNA